MAEVTLSILRVIPKDGTSYAVDDGGVTDIKLLYQVVLSRPLKSGELIPMTGLTSFTDGTTTIPAIGTEHPVRKGYYVAKYDVKQPTNSAKATLDVTVHYAAVNYTTTGGGQEPVVVDSNIEQWGWDDGTTTRDLVTARDNASTPVLNTAGDVFETVPQVETPTPTFTKVVRFAARKSGWFAYNCTVNGAQVDIGGVQCAAGTLLCTVAESVEPANEKWPYKYTVRLRYKSNICIINGGTTTECGWDAVVVNTGMRELKNGELKLIQVVSAETGQLVNVTSPELLDMSGQAVTRGSQSSTPPMYNLRFKAYPDATFPDWFVSEPPLANPPPSTSTT